MYLATDLSGSPGLFGEAYLNAGGTVINIGLVNAFNSPTGRLDTIAHELGHNLGLVHDDSNFNFLMASGSVRNIPNALGQICPDGPCYDLLSQDQINTVLQSSLLVDVPEPGTLILVATGLLTAVVIRRRRRN